MNCPYYCVKDYLSLNTKKYYSMDKKIPILFTERTVTYQMFFSIDDALLYTNFEIVNSNYDFVLSVEFDDSIPQDGYRLKVLPTGKIQIVSSSRRGILYAFTVLNDSIYIEESIQKKVLPFFEIYDVPSFPVRGVVEGFYGAPWTHEERLDMIDFMSQNRLNTYFYAPKDDIYHREKWNELYPEDKLNEILELKKRCDDHAMDFYYCISPGYAKNIEDSFHYRKEEMELLFRKLDQVIERGIKNFGLLLDDIQYTLTEEVKRKFQTPGEAHVYLCNQFYDYVVSKVPQAKIVMCPTEYHQVCDSLYKKTIREQLRENMNIFFTSDNVCAEIINDQQMNISKKAFGKKLYLWENYPVNDFTQGKRIFINPMINRTTFLPEYADAYVINPMNQAAISKISMVSLADYCWNVNKYNPEVSFEKGLKIYGEEFYHACKPFIKANEPSVITEGDNELYKEWVLENKKKYILQFYKELHDSVLNLFSLDLKVCKELMPWLESARIESEFVIKFYEEKKFDSDIAYNILTMKENLGNSLFLELAKKYKWVSTEKLHEITNKPHPWWKVWPSL